jgi:hypothetical protein
MEAHAAIQRQAANEGAEQDGAGSDPGLEAERSSTTSRVDHLGMLAAASRDAKAASPVAGREGTHMRAKHTPTESDAAPANSGLAMLLAGAAAVDTETRGNLIMNNSVDSEAARGVDTGRRGEDDSGSSQTILDGAANDSGSIAASNASSGPTGAGEGRAGDDTAAGASNSPLVSRKPQDGSWQTSFPGGDSGEASSQVRLASLVDEEKTSTESSSGDASDDDDSSHEETSATYD